MNIWIWYVFSFVMICKVYLHLHCQSLSYILLAWREHPCTKKPAPCCKLHVLPWTRTQVVTFPANWVWLCYSNESSMRFHGQNMSESSMIGLCEWSCLRYHGFQRVSKYLWVQGYWRHCTAFPVIVCKWLLEAACHGCGTLASLQWRWL